MDAATIATVLVLWTANDVPVLAAAYERPEECWAALNASDFDGYCISAWPVATTAPLRPQARPDDLCRAPCVALRPHGRDDE